MHWDLYVLTGGDTDRGRPVEEVVEAALLGGATAIQMREKALSGRELLLLAQRLRRLTKRYGVPLLINDRVDIALLADADGVHLGQSDVPAACARRLLGPGRIIGVTVDGVDQARQAQADGADYVGLGPFFPTDSKGDAGPPLGLDTLREVKAAIDIPVVAVGGVKRENARSLIAAGADGVAVISAVVHAPDVRQAAADLLAEVRAAKAERERKEV